MAHSNVRIVAADKSLSAVGQYATVGINAGVDYRFFTALAYSLYLGDRVGYLKQPSASLEQMRKEVCAKPEAQHGHVALVNYAAELVDLLGSKELTLVGNDRVGVAA